MADFNDSELFTVFDKASPSVGTKKKGKTTPLKRKKVQEPTTDLASGSKRSKKGPQSVTKVKPEVVVIQDSSDELEESNVVEPSTVDKKETSKESTDG